MSIMVEPDELKALRLLVHWGRQDFVNCSCEIARALSAGKLKDRTEKKLCDQLDEKRRNLDNFERALLVAETYSYDLIEERGLAELKQEEKEAEKHVKKEQSIKQHKDNIRTKKHRIQDWIDDRGSQYSSDVEILKTILQELGTIRNWIINPEEFNEINKTKYK